jgi:hypothetical protein
LRGLPIRSVNTSIFADITHSLKATQDMTMNFPVCSDRAKLLLFRPSVNIHVVIVRMETDNQTVKSKKKENTLIC